jgi:hypothetical protein
MQIVAAIITSIFFIIAVSSQDEGELMSAWPVKLYPPVESTYSTAPSHSQIVNPVIKINEGTIEFTSSEFGYYLLKALDVIITFACVIYITYLLREIFRTLSNNHPFTSENARRLRTIAILIVLVVPYKILRSILYYSYIKSNIALKGGEWIDWRGFFKLDTKGSILLTMDLDVNALILGILLLLITEIFRIGAALQEDKDSII